MKTMTKIAIGCVAMGAQAYAALTVPSTSFQVRQNPTDGNLYVQGEVGAYVNIPQSGSYTVTLQAAGTPAAGVYPIAGLSVNGLVYGRNTVNGTIWGNYNYTVQLNAGVQQIGFFLHNDLNNGVEDRNVFINSMTITQPAGLSNPALSNYSAWLTAAQARENQAVADSAAAIETYRKGPVTITVKNAQGQAINGASVTVEQLSHEFRFGASLAGYDVFGSTTMNNAYKDKFKSVFNYATLPTFWSVIEPVKGQPNYAWLDGMVGWASQNGMRMKGHGLLYNLAAAKPAWMTTMPTQQEQLSHMTEVMSRYKDYVGTWEVVNEPYSAPGMAFGAAEATAKSLMPNAELGVNEYGHFYNGYPEMYDFLQSAINNNVPVNMIGMQAHAPLDMAFPMDRVRDVLNRYAALGKPIHITEFTPSSGNYPVQGTPWRTMWSEATQAEYAEKFYRVAFSSAAVEAISWWDVSDAGSWCPQGGLLRADNSPKPSYNALNNLINNEWHTSVNGATNTSGNLEYRGFYGKYRVNVTVNGVTTTSEVNVTKGGANAYTITVNAPAQTADTTAPVITMNGSSSISVKRYTTYVDAGATAMDNVDGNLTASIVTTSTVNMSRTGTYYVRYNVKDAAGNVAAQKTRTVKVVR